MAGKGKVDITINAEDKASGKMKTIGKNTDAMADKMNKAKLAIMGMAVGMGVALGKMVTSYSKAGDEVQKMSKRVFWSTEALSEMRHVLGLSGSSLGALEKATRKMSKSIIDAQAGLETYNRAFTRIGINVNDLQGLKPEDQFWTIANALADMTDETQKVATAQEIFGSRVGTELLPMLASGSEAIANMRQEAHDLNMVFDQESADAAAAFEDAKLTMVTALKGLGNEISKVLMPILTDFFIWLTEKIKPAIAWLSEHPEVVKAFLIFAAALGGAAMVIAITKFISMMAGVITTIKVMIASMIALHAISGPGGWIKLAIGLGIAGGAIAGVMNLLNVGPFKNTPGGVDESGAPLPPGPSKAGGLMSALPGFQHGGIVPGPMGQPRLAVVHGGEEYLGVGRRSGVNLNFYIAGSVLTDRDLEDVVHQAMLKYQDRNVASGVV